MQVVLLGFKNPQLDNCARFFIPPDVGEIDDRKWKKPAHQSMFPNLPAKKQGSIYRPLKPLDVNYMIHITCIDVNV